MKIYITFGQIHTHRVNGITLDCDSVAAIECNSFKEGRERAMEVFDAKFHQSLTEDRIDEKFLSYFPRGIVEVGRI